MGKRTPEDYQRRLLNVQQAILREQVLANMPREDDSLRLTQFGSRSFCQCDEDGIIAEIFNRIGAETDTFVEIGVGDARLNNTNLLLLQGWSGLWVDRSKDHLTLARERYANYSVATLCAHVTQDNADEIVARFQGDKELDLLSIDIDGNDYWVWNTISAKPRVVVIEYNAIFPPHMCKTIEYDPDFVWNGDTYFGASLGALVELGNAKGYSLVGCSISGVNAFFVRDDVLIDLSQSFAAPFTAENHYEPARYALVEWTGLPPARTANWVDICT